MLAKGCFAFFFLLMFSEIICYLLVFLYNMLFRNMMKYFTKMTISGLYSDKFDTLEKTGVCFSFFLSQFFCKFLSFITVQTHLGFIAKP